MSKNILTVVIILIFIVGIIAVISYSSPDAPANIPDSTNTTLNEDPILNQPEETTVTVMYTDEGFSPASVTIRAGQSVTWINNSSDRMWVGSDPHPTHTNLPGFDQKAVANPGSAWTYTFTVPGTHTYHNHTNPGMKATVTVE